MAQQMEAKYVNEWLQLNYPDKLTWKRVRLGVLPTNELSRMYMVTSRWVDAVVLDDGKVILVEAKLRPQPGAISQLQLYDNEFPRTAMFKDLWNKQRELVFLTTREVSGIKELADAAGIRYAVYRPDWVIDYLSKR
jgi:hypothetical protein